MPEYDKWLEDVVAAAEEVMKGLPTIKYIEDVYEEALSHEMRIRDLPYERQRNFEMLYKGYTIGTGRVDFIINPFWATKKDENVLEIKATKAIDKSHIRQAQVYMTSLNIKKGAVMSFHYEAGLLVEPLELAAIKAIDRSVAKPRAKKGKELAELLKNSLKEVHDYLGTEFIYREGTNLDNYTQAMAVELSLSGVNFKSASFPITYKCQEVSAFDINFVFADNTALAMAIYKKQEEVDEYKDYYKYYAKRLGIKTIYIGLIPQKEDMEVMLCEI